MWYELELVALQQVQEHGWMEETKLDQEWEKFLSKRRQMAMVSFGLAVGVEVGKDSHDELAAVALRGGLEDVDLELGFAVALPCAGS